MKIAVFGLGYVGTVTAVVLTEPGHKVEGNVQEQAAINEFFNDKRRFIGRSWNQVIQLHFPRYSAYRALGRALVAHIPVDL
jgi:UDP-glucose 6-dehydrogenase